MNIYKYLEQLCLVAMLFITTRSEAQSPQAIPYQAIARNSGGDLLINKNISLRFSLHDVTSSGAIIYQEIQAVNTGSMGLFTANIGEGSVTVGSFPLINWGSGNKFLQVEIDTAGGVTYTDMGTQQLMSVPYALYSGNGGSWNSNGNAIYNSNTGNVGIGISSPDTKLHVYNSSAPTMFTIGGSAMNGGYTALSIGVSSDMNGYSVIQSVKSSGSAWGDLILNPNEGNIGIGTTFPRRKLEILGDISMGDWTMNFPSRRFGVMDGSTQTAGFEIENTSLGGNFSQKLHFVTHHYNNSYGRRVTIDEDGNVGIGTETPAAKLDLIGNLRIADGTQGAGKLLKSDANGAATWDTFDAGVLFAGGVPSALNFSCMNVIGTVTTGTSPNSMALQGNFVYLVNSGNNTFQIINISNPAAPVIVSTTSCGTSVKSIAISGNYAFILNYSSSIIRVFDVSNPALPVQTAALSGYSFPHSIAISSGYAYVVSPISGLLTIINISNPLSCTFVSSCSVGADAIDVTVEGNYAYVINSPGDNFKIVDISNPATPVVVSSIATGSFPQSVFVSGNYAYVANQLNNSVSVFNISNPASPSLASTIATAGYPISVMVSGSNLLVACFLSNVLQIFDISNPSAPVAAGLVGTATGPSDVTLAGNHPIVINSLSNTLQVFSSCPSTPIVDPITGDVTPQFVTWNNSGSNIYNINAGNVGIGTTSPQNKLSVSGSTDISGSIGLGVTAPQARLHVKDGTLLCEGASGGVPISGAGARMMWIPSLSAFRAGIAGATSWNGGNIGISSFAAGNGTTASSYSSFAIGTNTVASNTNAFAMGSNSTASGVASVAFGEGTQSTGNVSFAIGHNAIASNTDAVAIGSLANASGASSFALGAIANASGTSSFALGATANASATDAVAIGSSVTASGAGSMAFGNNVSTNLKSGSLIMGDYLGGSLSSDQNNQFSARFRSGYRLFTNNSLTTGVFLSAGAGAWSNISDREKKENFTSIDAEDILQKVAKLPISSWNYKSQPVSQRHVGCMAQDFYAAFKLDGESDTTINSLDLDGINMTAIQALKTRTDDLKLMTEQLKATTEDLLLSAQKIEMLEQEIAELKKLMRANLKN